MVRARGLAVLIIAAFVAFACGGSSGGSGSKGEIDIASDLPSGAGAGREVACNVDLTLGAAASAATAAGECDERRDDEDCESPSSNHMVPPCVSGKAPSGLKLPLIRRPLPNLPWYLDDDRGESAPAANAATWGGRTYYSVQNFTIGSANLAEFALIWVRSRINMGVRRCNPRFQPISTRKAGPDRPAQRSTATATWCRPLRRSRIPLSRR